MMEQYLQSRSLTIEVTNACPCHCVICPRDKRTKPIKTMDFDFFRRIVDQGVEGGMDILTLCGFGEAFMDKGLLQKIEYVKQQYPFVSIYLSTTGFLLNDFNIGEIVPLLDTLKISHFSDDEETFRKMHGKATDYRTTEIALEKVCALPQNIRPYLIFLFVQTKINEGETTEWIQRWEPKVDEVMVWKTHNWAGQWPSEFTYLEQEPVTSCGRPFHGDLNIHSDGTVSPCCFDFDGKMIIGDLTQQTLKEIYFGDALKRIQEVHQKKTFCDSGLLCAKCDQIRSREGSLVYATNKDRKVGVITSSRLDRMNNVLDGGL